ncbi:hypothetical protein JTB14_019644 [Gonioctena quinquepunctata]|nr:hypothetical protein JTB14_019644 [Gonioctena quinquepunctata]
MQHRGHKYSGMFKTLKNLTVCEDGTVSTVEWKSKWTYLMEAMFQQQLFLAGERNQEIHVPKFIQKVALSLSLLPLQKSEVDVTFEYATSIISTDGIQISGMTTIPLDSEDHSRFDGIEYIPLDGTYTKIESGIDFAIQLTLADYIGQDEKVYLFLTELKTESPLTKHIENVLDESDKTQISFTSVEEVSRIIVHPTHPQLFIVNGPVSDDIVKLTLSSGASLLTKADKKLLSNPTLIQVAQFRVGVNEYVILKKVVGVILVSSMSKVILSVPKISGGHLYHG